MSHELFRNHHISLHFVSFIQKMSAIYRREIKLRNIFPYMICYSSFLVIIGLKCLVLIYLTKTTINKSRFQNILTLNHFHTDIY